MKKIPDELEMVLGSIEWVKRELLFGTKLDAQIQRSMSIYLGACLRELRQQLYRLLKDSDDDE